MWEAYFRGQMIPVVHAGDAAGDGVRGDDDGGLLLWDFLTIGQGRDTGDEGGAVAGGWRARAVPCAGALLVLAHVGLWLA